MPQCDWSQSAFHLKPIGNLYSAGADITIMRTLPTIIANSQETYWFAAVLVAYYLCVWLLVSRRRDGRSIAVCYTPPDGLSPAAIRYICTMCCDGRSYA